jgi:O-antigen ligase/Flp pilus assembly protein TadD
MTKQGHSSLALELVIGLLIFAVPLAYSSFAPLTLKWALIGLVTPTIAFLWLWGGCGRPFRPLPQLLLPLLTLMLVAEISLFQVINLYYGLQMIAFALTLFLLYLTVVYAFSWPERRDRLLRCLTVALLVVSIVSLYRYITRDPFLPSTPAQSLVQSFGNTNYAAAYYLTVIPLSAVLFLQASQVWERILWGLTLFLSVIVLILSMVRGAWVSLVIGLAVLLWVLFRRQQSHGATGAISFRSMITGTLLLGVAALFAYALWPQEIWTFEERVASIFDPGTDSLQTRLIAWQGTLRMIKDYFWTGVGVGNFTFAYVPYRSAHHYERVGTRFEHPHNEYLAIWSELGPLGLLAFLWLIVRIVRLSSRLANAPGRNTGMLAGVLGCLAASAAYANFFYVFNVPASAMNFALLLGVLDGMSWEAGKDIREPQSKDVQAPPLSLAWLFPGLCVLYLLCFQYILRPLGGEVHYYLAAAEFQGQRMETGLEHLAKAVKWHPHSFTFRFRRAAVLFVMKRYEETIQEAKAVLEIHPKMEIAYGIMASAYIQLGDVETGKDLFIQALAINPNYPHALNNLGVLAHREGRNAEAEFLFLKAKEILVRTEMGPYANLGNLYREAGRYREALEMYETAVAIKPQFAHNWYNVALLRVRSGDPSGAYGPLARAIALDEVWRDKAVQEPVFEGLRRKDARVRILLRLE